MQSGDNLSSIASHYGLASNSIASYNRITSVYSGELVYLPFYADTIETNVSGLTGQNTYDYYILDYSVRFHLNPMLIKAEVYDESLFNSTAISRYDAPPGVCGMGHSYGLLQYTPACFGGISSYGIAWNATPNVEILGGQNGALAVISCTLLSCQQGDYLALEYSDVINKNITSVLVEQPQYGGWNNSVFNPQENLYHAMQIEGNDIDIDMAGYKCTYAQYNYMALGQYQQSVDQIVTGCGQMNAGMPYADSIIQTYYSELAQSAVYGWTDEYA